MWNAGFGGGFSGPSMGGGYTESPGGFGSPSATQGEKKSRSRSQNLVPCTVSQLLSAEQVDEAFKVQGVEISQVVITGIIRQAEKAPTNILYKVDDMTAAPMDVRQWVDTDEAGSENIVVPPGTYVKVVGHLRSFQNKKSLVAFKLMPLEDMNVLTTHLLEVVNAHMSLRKESLQSASMMAPRSFAPSGMGSTASYGGSLTMPVGGLSPHQSQVLNLIKSSMSTEGISLQELKSQLHNMNMATINEAQGVCISVDYFCCLLDMPKHNMKAVEFLSSEGHIYSTVDDDHFKSTDAE